MDDFLIKHKRRKVDEIIYTAVVQILQLWLAYGQILFLGLCLGCCFSSLMRAKYMLKIYWVFPLTKLTHSWCFKHSREALNAASPEYAITNYYTTVIPLLIQDLNRTI